MKAVAGVLSYDAGVVEVFGTAIDSEQAAERVLAGAILGGEFTSGDRVLVDHDGARLTFRRAEPMQAETTRAAER